MKVRTRGPLEPEKYEALVNYDDPLHPFGYWTRERRGRLLPETLARLESTYPAKSRVKRTAIGAPKADDNNNNNNNDFFND
jgi:hypothetical protein